eukprot:scpid86595/ scgid24837/ 
MKVVDRRQDHFKMEYISKQAVESLCKDVEFCIGKEDFLRWLRRISITVSESLTSTCYSSQSLTFPYVIFVLDSDKTGTSFSAKFLRHIYVGISRCSQCCLMLSNLNAFKSYFQVLNKTTKKPWFLWPATELDRYRDIVVQEQPEAEPFADKYRLPLCSHNVSIASNACQDCCAKACSTRRRPSAAALHSSTVEDEEVRSLMQACADDLAPHGDIACSPSPPTLHVDGDEAPLLSPACSTTIVAATGTLTSSSPESATFGQAKRRKKTRCPFIFDEAQCVSEDEDAESDDDDMDQFIVMSSGDVEEADTVSECTSPDEPSQEDIDFIDDAESCSE